MCFQGDSAGFGWVDFLCHFGRLARLAIWIWYVGCPLRGRRIAPQGALVAYCGGIQLRQRLRRDKLGLIGFVFLGGVGRDIGVSLCIVRGCRNSEVSGIGFVLHNHVGNSWQVRQDKRFGGAQIKMQMAELWNPDPGLLRGGMGGLIVLVCHVRFVLF